MDDLTRAVDLSEAQKRIIREANAKRRDIEFQISLIEQDIGSIGMLPSDKRRLGDLRAQLMLLTPDEGPALAPPAEALVGGFRPHPAIGDLRGALRASSTPPAEASGPEVEEAIKRLVRDGPRLRDRHPEFEAHYIGWHSRAGSDVADDIDAVHRALRATQARLEQVEVQNYNNHAAASIMSEDYEAAREVMGAKVSMRELANECGRARMQEGLLEARLKEVEAERDAAVLERDERCTNDHDAIQDLRAELVAFEVKVKEGERAIRKIGENAAEAAREYAARLATSEAARLKAEGEVGRVREAMQGAIDAIDFLASNAIHDDLVQGARAAEEIVRQKLESALAAAPAGGEQPQ